MRNFLTTMLVGVLLMGGFLFVGCHGHHTTKSKVAEPEFSGNLSIEVFENNTVVATVTGLPSHHYACLIFDEGKPFHSLILADGKFFLGVFEAGTYDVCIHYFLNTEGLKFHSQKNVWYSESGVVRDYTGESQCVSFTIESLGDDPPLPPDDDDDDDVDENVLLMCNLNEDGGVVFVIENAPPNSFLRLIGIDSTLLETPIVDGEVYLYAPLSPGEYLGEVFLGADETLLARCEMTVPQLDDEGDVNDDEDDEDLGPLPPPGHNCGRYAICIRGHVYFVCWLAYKVHIRLHGATPGFGGCGRHGGSLR